MSLDLGSPLSLVHSSNNVVALKLASTVALLPEFAVPANSGIPTHDWDLLFHAIEGRLDAIAVDLIDGQDRLPRTAATVIAQLALGECVASLRNLHHILADERRQQHRRESEFLATSAALAHARASLVDAEDRARSARRKASLDSLTELPNRGHFVERTNTALADLGGARVALAALYIDLDNFKAVNDLHGHFIGDQVLQIVAARLVGAMRAEDIVGRLGGDEFACLLTSLPSKTQLMQLASKLFDTVSSPMRIGTLELTVGASIGIAICPADGETSEALLRSADEAMYRAKRGQTGYAFVERAPVA